MKTRSPANWDKQRKSLSQMIKKRLSLIILLGIFITPIVSFFIGYFFGQMITNGAFVQWHLLGTPDGKISERLGICNNTLCVETFDQKIYTPSLACQTGSPMCLPDDKTKIEGWEEAGKTIKSEVPFATPGCMWIKFVVANPPGEVAQSIETKQCGIHAQQTKYVVLDDGSIWLWTHQADDEDPLLWYILYGPIAAFIGFIVWVVIAIIFSWVD